MALMRQTVEKNRRQARHEELREKMSGIRYLQELDKIADELEVGNVSRERLEILKVRINLSFKRLAKLLPDEQFIEVQGQIDSSMTVRKVSVNGVEPTDSQDVPAAL